MELTPEEIEALKAEKERLEAKVADLESKASETENEDGTAVDEKYVKKLRDEAAKYRVRAKEADREKQELLEKYKDIDPEKHKELVEAQAEAERKAEEAERERLEKAGEYEKLLEKNKADYQAALDKKAAEVKEAAERAEALENELNNSFRSREIMAAADTEGAISKGVVERLLALETKVVVAEDGSREVVVLDESQQERLVDGRPMTVSERLAEMKQDKDTAHLFGGGTAGAGSKTETQTSGKSAHNPFKAEQFNLTEQGKALRDDPASAKRLIIEAGLDPKQYKLD